MLSGNLSLCFLSSNCIALLIMINSLAKKKKKGKFRSMKLLLEWGVKMASSEIFRDEYLNKFPLAKRKKKLWLWSNNSEQWWHVFTLTVFTLLQKASNKKKF